MLKGIYRAASAMIPRLKQQEITANNIANASTPGFKRDSVFLKELTTAQKSAVPKKSVWQTPMIDQIYTDYAQGPFDRTNDLLDLALEGDGFFILQGAEDETAVYTRNGNFLVDPEGFLANSEGLRVQGDGGPIDVGGGTVTINEAGEVLVDGDSAGRLQVVDFPDKSALVKVGSSGFTVDETVEAVPAEGYSVRQGFLEKSNINIIKEMIGMIITLRHFESGQRAIQSQDESLAVLFNQVGRTRM